MTPSRSAAATRNPRPARYPQPAGVPVAEHRVAHGRGTEPGEDIQALLRVPGTGASWPGQDAPLRTAYLGVTVIYLGVTVMV